MDQLERTVTLSDGLTVSPQGLGCMGMSDYYGPTDWDESLATVRRALDLGVTFLDTADIYGFGHNEVLVGRAITGRRDEVTLATKFGIERSPGGRGRGERAYVKYACEASLLRLGVETIDLYYLHRPPETAEIEETVAAMAELVAEGKVRHLGLSNVGSSLLRRGNAVHPIAAVQSEYSLWSRDPETRGLLDTMRELGIGLVAYSPLGRAFLTGELDVPTLDGSDYRSRLPRFTGAAGDANQAVVRAVRAVAGRHDVTPAQVALAWIAAQSERLAVPVVPIPGTKRTRWLEQNVAAVDLRLTDVDLAELDPLAAGVVGSSY